MSETQIRWVVFFGLAFAVPLPFQGGVIGGIASLLIVVEIFFAFLLSTIVTFSYPVLPLILAINVGIYAAVLIALSKGAAYFLGKLAPDVRSAVVIAALLGLVLLGFLPMYFWGFDDGVWGNLYQTYASVAREMF